MIYPLSKEELDFYLFDPRYSKVPDLCYDSMAPTRIPSTLQEICKRVLEAHKNKNWVELTNLLEYGFVWSTTSQGQEFWETIAFDEECQLDPPEEALIQLQIWANL